MVSSKTTALSVAVTLLSASGVDAFWRMPCRSRTGLGRLDPIMDPGEVSDHTHAIHGGSNFGMSSTSSDLMASNCTSCEVTQDKSAYWTPSLHFIYPNGSSVIVPQVGGMLAYYLLYSDTSDPDGKITAFPEGFQMISGDKRLRDFKWPVPDPPKSDWSGDQASQKALQQKALGFNCMNYAAAAEPSLYRHFLPDKSYLDANCLDGVRFELMFPSCWNGKDLDSDDHRSHVAFPSQVMTGECPEGFKTKLPSLFYETIWNTHAFAGVDGQFSLSHGDPTGYGYHGDFITGWESVDFLQNAVDTCTNASGEIEDCPLFNIQDDSTAAQCTFEMPEVLADEDCEGPLDDGLPVSVPIQAGPGYATIYPVVLPGGKTLGLGSGGSSSTGGAAPSSSSAAVSLSASAVISAVVPTLTYSAATASITDKYGGGILVANTVSSYPPSSASVSSGSQVTVAASVADADGSSDDIVATSTMTQDGQVIEMYIEEVDVTVIAEVTATATATETANAKARRHLDHHQQHRRLRHNGAHH
ncbi:hypothetical protein AAFC00_000645 [Neodothiora populina]|uniref:DUF1996 domain-containing protein n=1 Tax=Neodothiora populina TaxID=2781224 RepID=A0ABR3PES5_9PEZI